MDDGAHEPDSPRSRVAAVIERDNTLTNPLFHGRDRDASSGSTSPSPIPRSPMKAWTNGLNPANDEYRRFEYGEPPAKNGDYAYPAPPPRVPQEHRQGCDHHAARGPLPGKPRG